MTIDLQRLAKLGNRLAYHANESNEQYARETAEEIAAVCGIGEKKLISIAPTEGPPSWYAVPAGALSHNPETGRLKYNPLIAINALGWRSSTRPSWFDAVANMYNGLIAQEIIADCIDPVEIAGAWMRPEWSPAQWVQIAQRVLELAPQIGYSAEQIAAARKRVPA